MLMAGFRLEELWLANNAHMIRNDVQCSTMPALKVSKTGPTDERVHGSNHSECICLGIGVSSWMFTQLAGKPNDQCSA